LQKSGAEKSPKPISSSCAVCLTSKETDEKQAPADKKDAALERVDELQQEVTSKQPQPSTLNISRTGLARIFRPFRERYLAGGESAGGEGGRGASSVAADAIRKQFGAK